MKDDISLVKVSGLRKLFKPGEQQIELIDSDREKDVIFAIADESDYKELGEKFKHGSTWLFANGVLIDGNKPGVVSDNYIKSELTEAEDISIKANVGLIDELKPEYSNVTQGYFTPQSAYPSITAGKYTRKPEADDVENNWIAFINAAGDAFYAEPSEDWDVQEQTFPLPSVFLTDIWDIEGAYLGKAKVQDSDGAFVYPEKLATVADVKEHLDKIVEKQDPVLTLLVDLEENKSKYTYLFGDSSEECFVQNGYVIVPIEGDVDLWYESTRRQLRIKMANEETALSVFGQAMGEFDMDIITLAQFAINDYSDGPQLLFTYHFEIQYVEISGFLIVNREQNEDGSHYYEYQLDPKPGDPIQIQYERNPKDPDRYLCKVISDEDYCKRYIDSGKSLILIEELNEITHQPVPGSMALINASIQTIAGGNIALVASLYPQLIGPNLILIVTPSGAVLQKQQPVETDTPDYLIITDPAKGAMTQINLNIKTLEEIKAGEKGIVDPSVINEVCAGFMDPWEMY